MNSSGAKRNSRNFTYSGVGVDRTLRTTARSFADRILRSEREKFPSGTPISLPFSTIFPVLSRTSQFFDFQIEGVGTKTLLAELSGSYSTIGIDAVAMVVNDVIRSGAEPILISDAIHISESRIDKLQELLSGIRSGVHLSGCTLASGETGDVPEILHEKISKDSPSFDLIASCLGMVRQDEQIIFGNISRGDRVIGLQSSGIHSNGLTLARKILLKKWGGSYDPWAIPDSIERPIIEELLEPTRIYARAFAKSRKGIQFKAAIHVTGDGFGKFRRLINWTKKRGVKIGFQFQLKNRIPGIFRLIMDSAKSAGRPISMTEMFKTFNMGYGFALIVDAEDSEDLLQLLNNYLPADDIGCVTDSQSISLRLETSGKTLVL